MRTQSSRPLLDRFWPKVDRRADDACWPWLGARDKVGYGSMRGEGGRSATTRKAHHVAWIAASGHPIPAGMIVRHTCDNPSCVNPRHLVLGTKADNSRDMKERGRSATGDRNGTRTRPDRTARGNRIPQAKLTPDLVRAIRAAYASGQGSQQRIADAFGVSGSAVQRVVRRVDWKHVD